MNNLEFRAELLNEAANILLENIVLTESSDGDDSTVIDSATDNIEDIKAELETAEAVADVKKSVSKINKIIGNLAKWYYKITPDKKFNALRKVLKIVNLILYQISSTILLNGIISRIVARSSKGRGGSDTADKTSEFQITLGAVSVATQTAARGILFTKLGVKLGLKSIITTLISFVVGCISVIISNKGFFGGIDANYKLNIRDYEANLEELTKLSTTLKDSGAPDFAVAKVTNCIVELKKEKAKWDFLKYSDISSRGAVERNIEKADTQTESFIAYGNLANACILTESVELLETLSNMEI